VSAFAEIQSSWPASRRMPGGGVCQRSFQARVNIRLRSVKSDVVARGENSSATANSSSHLLVETGSDHGCGLSAVSLAGWRPAELVIPGQTPEPPGRRPSRRLSGAALRPWPRRLNRPRRNEPRLGLSCRGSGGGRIETNRRRRIRQILNARGKMTGRCFSKPIFHRSSVIFLTIFSEGNQDKESKGFRPKPGLRAELPW